MMADSSEAEAGANKEQLFPGDFLMLGNSK